MFLDFSKSVKVCGNESLNYMFYSCQFVLFPGLAYACFTFLYVLFFGFCKDFDVS